MKLYLPMTMGEYVELISSGIYHLGCEDIVTDITSEKFNLRKYILRNFQQDNGWDWDPICCDVTISTYINDRFDILLTLDADDKYVRLVDNDGLYDIYSLPPDLCRPFNYSEYLTDWDYEYGYPPIEDITPIDILNRFTMVGWRPNEYEDDSDDFYVQLDRFTCAYVPFVKRDWIVDCVFLNKIYSNCHLLDNPYRLCDDRRPLLVSCRRDILNYCIEKSINIKEFNRPIIISPYAVDLTHLLQDCESFNQKVIFLPLEDDTKREIYCGRMFYNCKNFNQDIVLPEGVVSCDEMFSGCEKFNSDVIIPDTAVCCYRMFYGCTSLNKSIVIPKSVTDCEEMFFECDSLEAPIYVHKNFNMGNVYLIESGKKFLISIVEDSNDDKEDVICELKHISRLSEESYERYPYIK